MSIKKTSWRFLRKLYMNQEKLNIGFKDNKKGVFDDENAQKNWEEMPDKNTYKTFNRQEKNRKLENQRLIDFEYI